MPYYCTLDYAKNYMAAQQAATSPPTLNDQRILSSIRTASARIDNPFQQLRPMFLPYNEVRPFQLTADMVNSYYGIFSFIGNLLELTSVAVNAQAVTVPTQVATYPPGSIPPFNQIAWASPLSFLWGLGGNCFTVPFINIGGVWGFQRDYPNAWQAVDTLSADMDATQTTLAGTNFAAPDLYGLAPCISAGSFIKVENEWMQVTLTNANTNVATVLRGQNGTVAASHTHPLPISVWQVEEPVQRAVARQAGLMVARIGSYVSVDVQPMGSVVYPQDWLYEVYGMLDGYAYR